jgi:glutathione S-transferase
MTVYVKPKLVENFAYVESELATKPYFAGDHLTGADSTSHPPPPS